MLFRVPLDLFLPPLPLKLSKKQTIQAVKAAREKLSTIVKARLEAAANAGNHENVLRFIRLHRPLGLLDEGKAWFGAHLRKLVAKRAQESYDLLMERTGKFICLFLCPQRGPFLFFFCSTFRGRFDNVLLLLLARLWYRLTSYDSRHLRAAASECEPEQKRSKTLENGLRSAFSALIIPFRAIASLSFALIRWAAFIDMVQVPNRSARSREGRRAAKTAKKTPFFVTRRSFSPALRSLSCFHCCYAMFSDRRAIVGA